MRQVMLPSGRSAILSDTVGFISDLPPMLIKAFQVGASAADLDFNEVGEASSAKLHARVSCSEP